MRSFRTSSPQSEVRDEIRRGMPSGRPRRPTPQTAGAGSSTFIESVIRVPAGIKEFVIGVYNGPAKSDDPGPQI